MAYPFDCGDDILDPHYCEDGCEDIGEHARIRKGAWIHQSVYPQIAADPTNAAVWNIHKAAGKIIVLPLLTGTFDGGAPKTITGFGDTATRLTGFDFSATVRDPVYKQNHPHYKSLVGKSSWHFAYVTETQVHISGKPVTAIPKNAVTDSLDDLVVWESTITWTEKFTPAPHDAPDVFTCENPQIAPVIVQQPVPQNITSGAPVVLSVVASGTGPLSYQWKKNGTVIAGATGAGYTVTGAHSTDSGDYTVVVTNALGSVTSNPAAVTVTDLTFDTILTFTSAVTDTKESVSGTVGATNATQELQFNKDTSITGLPTNMSLTLGGSEVMSVDFPSDYLSRQFRYINTNGTAYLGTFAAGSVAL